MNDVKYKYRLYLTTAEKGDPLCEIKYSDVSYTENFPTVSIYNELEFTVPYYEDGWEMNKDERYDLLKNLYFVLLEAYDYNEDGQDGNLEFTEYFVINKPSEKSGKTASKKISCYSSHYNIFTQRKFRSYSKTQLLYDPALPNDQNAGLLNYITNQIYKSYTVGYVHADFLNITRIWEYSSNSYGNVLKDIMNQLNCIIKIDTVNNTINVYKSTELGEDSDLVISRNNYATNISKSDNPKSLVTRLRVYGYNNIGINSQHATGQSYIDDFTYLLNNGNFSSSLESAMNSYNTLLSTKKTEFQGYLTTLNGHQADLLTNQNQLAGLNTDLKIIEDDLDLLKQGSFSNTSTYDTRYIDYTNKLTEIGNKQNDIDTIQASIDAVNADIATLYTEVSYETNFTSQQLIELSNFIFEDTLTVKTITDEALLYEYASEYFDILSSQAIEISIDMTDIYQLGDGQKLRVGNLVYVNDEQSELDNYQSKVVKIKHSPFSNKVKITISNNDQLNTALNNLSTNILKKAQEATENLEVNEYDYSQYVTEKSQIIFSGDSIDSDVNEITSSNSVINRRGFIGSDVGGNGQIQLLGDRLVISDDNMETFHTLLSGAGLYLESANKYSRIVLTPDNGFQIDKNVGSIASPNWTNKFYVDSSGNVTLSGNIVMEGGSISWTNVTPPTAEDVGALPDDTYIPTLPSYIKSTYIDSTTVQSPSIVGGTIVGGQILSTSTINVGTDLTVGNNIYIGNQGATATKYVNFATGTRISGGDDGILPWLRISTHTLNLIDPEAISIGNPFTSVDCDGSWDFSSASVSGISVSAVYS